MNTIKHVTYWLFLLTFPFAASLADTQDSTIASLQAQFAKPDYAKEQRWAGQVVDFIIDGEPVWLEADQHKFLGIYTEATTPKVHGAVILVHGGGVHPDWQQVIKPLRTTLPNKGWATLSIQMPVLANRAVEREYVPLFRYVPGRIDAAVKFLQQHNIKRIVLAGHSLGASMASYYMATSANQDIDAFIGIGMDGSQQPKEYRVLDNVASLLQIKVPVLDVYGQYTNETVLGSKYRRAFALNSVGNKYSKQIFIRKADHFYEGYEQELIDKMYHWMEDTLVAANAGKQATDKTILQTSNMKN
jgi:pimeloyl-ACP methyl ester carboxylesterase